MLRSILICLTGAFILISPVTAEPLKLGHPTWVGFGPLYIAQEKGYFTEEGLDVELIVIEDVKLRYPALAAGRIDVLATSVDTVLNFLSEQQSYRYLFAMDDSNGGDGIVANNEIASIADLKGKTVAYTESSVSQFYLGVLLKDVGLGFSDVKSQNMTAGDAGAAFVAGRVDAAVTWEPWLTRGKQAEHGHLLIDSSSLPGMLTDVMVTTPDKLATRKADFQALYRAWNKALQFQQADPDQADVIMAKGVGGWLKDPKIFAETRAGIAYYDEARNRAFMGNADTPGDIMKTLNYAIEIGTELGQFKINVDPKELIAPGIIE